MGGLCLTSGVSLHWQKEKNLDQGDTFPISLILMTDPWQDDEVFWEAWYHLEFFYSEEILLLIVTVSNPPISLTVDLLDKLLWA